MPASGLSKVFGNIGIRNMTNNHRLLVTCSQKTELFSPVPCVVRTRARGAIFQDRVEWA